jgi:hypothetical protein
MSKHARTTELECNSLDWGTGYIEAYIRRDRSHTHTTLPRWNFPSCIRFTLRKDHYQPHLVRVSDLVRTDQTSSHWKKNEENAEES